MLLKYSMVFKLLTFLTRKLHIVRAVTISKLAQHSHISGFVAACHIFFGAMNFQMPFKFFLPIFFPFNVSVVVLVFIFIGQQSFENI